MGSLCLQAGHPVVLGKYFKCQRKPPGASLQRQCTDRVQTACTHGQLVLKRPSLHHFLCTSLDK
ncbi:hypothetical protein HPB50_002347 [Hyalomma asiaticum]|uniref:Uncharacterized protein n=1 Tax=Hyalomma asiaticum TaxID=266040 RepID=A0ACB7TD38_HYAAI|nr:hypothetical protein HPB50_002347 [Hyalomma asiaticum]